MAILARILESVVGKAHLVVFIGKKPAFEVAVENKTIIINVKNPVLAIEFGIQELLKKKKLDKTVLKEVKGLGYGIKIKYKMFEFEL